MKQPETILQIACMDYLRLQYPKVLAWHVANERRTSPQRGAKLKRMGVLSGVSDLCIMQPNDDWHGLFVELKCGKNKPTDNQNRVMARLLANGYMVQVCYSFDEFKEVVDSYLG